MGFPFGAVFFLITCFSQPFLGATGVRAVLPRAKASAPVDDLDFHSDIYLLTINANPSLMPA